MNPFAAARMALLVACCLSQAITAHASAAEPAEGKVLHDKACIACHARMYGGDGSKMYTRSGRMLSDRTELQQRVATCSAQASTGWFPEEEALVAHYLNQHYYHFK